MIKTFVSSHSCTLQSQQSQCCCFIVFAGRDKILLDGTDAGGSRDLDDYDNEEEVFALKGLADDDESDDQGDYDEDEDADGSEEEIQPIQPKGKKSKKAKALPTPAEDPSDNSESEEERWGKNKSAYYSSAAKDAVDSDDEETRAMEEAEARRLQAKARELVNEDDFGFDDLDVVADKSETLYVPLFIFFAGWLTE